MNRAMPSAILPNASWSTWTFGSSVRRASFGVSRRSATSASRRVVEGCRRGCVGRGLVVDPAPVLWQQVVEHVVDADRPQQSLLPVHDGDGQQVVGREQARDLQ